MSLTTKAIAVIGGVLTAVALGGGIASAQPGVDAAVNSTCTYPQFIAALTDRDAAASAQLQSSPLAVAYVQDFIGAPPGSDDRRARIAQLQTYPEFASYAGLIFSAAASCSGS